MLFVALMVIASIDLIIVIVKAFKSQSKLFTFEINVSLTKGFTLKFKIKNKKDAPPKQD